MAPSATDAPGPERHSACSTVTGLLGDWIRQGTEGFVAAQKILLDLTAQQNALALSIIRERVGISPPSAKKLAGFAGDGVKTMLDVQRNVLNLIGRQNSLLQAGLKTRLPNGPLSPAAEVLHQSLDAFIDAQNKLLNMIQSQTEGAVSDFEQDKGFETGRFAEMAREGMRIFLEGQKHFLDIVQEQIATKTAASPENAPEALELLEMAKRSVDAVVETQKNLLDLASNQVKANVTFAREVFSFDAQPTTFSDVVKKSVDSFVAAQKALVDLAAKPRTSAPDGEAGHAAAA